MMKAGYSKNFWYRVTESAIKKYENLVEKEINGEQNIYRNKQEILEDKASRRKDSKSGWFRRKGFNATLQVENTPSGQLARQIRSRIRNDPHLASMKILVAEKNGLQLGNISNFSDPEVPEYFSREDCFVCMTASQPTRGSCWKEGISYHID